MPDKHQFTLKWLLVEVVLVGVVFAIVRKVFFTDHKLGTDLQIPMMFFLGLPCSLMCAGAAIGRVFCDLKWSTPWTVILLSFFLFVAVMISAS